MMNTRSFRWNDWNREHIAVHGVTPLEAEYVVDHATTPYPEYIGEDKWRVLAVCGGAIPAGDLCVRRGWHVVCDPCPGTG
jgi:hypothetical protein